ncbi:MAG TPA: hypothetical protein VFS74_11585, partial [Gemmatimonadales bacterium]|nr:hypothetical protein [Gemmatimonadales bacterium]
LRDLVTYSPAQLNDVKNVGDKAIEEIASVLKRERLNFGMTFEDVDGDVRVLNEGQSPDTVVAAPAEGDAP